MTFFRGQKVVCVDDHFEGYGFRAPNRPKKGPVYTVRDVYGAARGTAIRLVEIENPLHISGNEYGFYARRFRPAVTRKTDISIFKEILTNPKAPIRELENT